MDKQHTGLFSSNPNAVVTSRRFLYTPSEFARTVLFHLQEIGELTALRPHVSKRTGLASYLFFIVESGSGRLIYDKKEYELTEGDCVFINCLRPYSHSANSNDLWKLKWCHFYGSSLGLIYQKYLERGGMPVFRPLRIEPFFQTWKRLIDAVESEDYTRDMEINSGIAELLKLLMVNSWHPENKVSAQKRQSMGPIREYLEMHYNERISLNELSKKFYIDKFYLTKCFKEQFGINLRTYLMNIRITHAKQMLRFTDSTIEEIGYLSGIGTPSYFSRVFKNVEGISPNEYREQWQNQYCTSENQ